MSRFARATLASLMLLVPQARAEAPARHDTLFGAHWAPSDVQTFDLEHAGLTYRLLVSLPQRPAPPKGYGVIYAWDAAWTFGTLRDLARLSDPQDNGRRATVVVAIGWPTENLVDLKRRGAELAGRQEDLRPQALSFLTDRLIPHVEGKLKVDTEHRMLLGHSFGGAFTLWAQAKDPEVFSHYGVGSPSIWADPEGLNPQTHPKTGKVIITLGELEHPDAAAEHGEDAARLAKLRERDIHGRAITLATKIDAPVVIVPQQTHGGSIPAFLSAAFRFLWQE